MTAADVKIGNVVFDRHHNFEVVTETFLDGKIDRINGAKATSYSGVKLGEEILSLFNFHRAEFFGRQIFESGETGFRIMASDHVNGKFCMAIMDDCGMTYRPHFTPFEFLHELQNLHRFVEGKDFQTNL